MNFDKDKLYLASAWQIAEAVRTSKISAFDVAKSFIARVGETEGSCHAWAHLNESYYLQQARTIDKAERRGILAGVPIGVKDIFNTEILPTEMGSAVWQGHRAGNDARCVSYLRRDGGVIAGKTDTAEFAVHVPGCAKNPWSDGHVTGTSSGGSVVAVATANVPLALTTQTAGSTIRPSSWCGVYGMKPSFGVIPRTGVLKTTDTLDNIGFCARSNKDLRLCFNSMRVRGQNYPIVERSLTFHAERPHKGWRIGLISDNSSDVTKPYVTEAISQLASDIDQLDNVKVVDVELPVSRKTYSNLHRRLYNSCLAYYFRDELTNSPDSISKSFKDLAKQGSEISPKDYSLALEEQSKLAKQFDAFYVENSIDFLLCPSSDGSAPKLQEPSSHRDRNLLWTLTWLPVITVPQFRCPDGLPFGYQVVGPRYNDYRMFEFIEHLVANDLAPKLTKVATPKYR
jgi:Asp-tRNA(Asn)/Glu-tRNA(Gln) amidotransferase A subunit family amidase